MALAQWEQVSTHFTKAGDCLTYTFVSDSSEHVISCLSPRSHPYHIVHILYMDQLDIRQSFHCVSEISRKIAHHKWSYNNIIHSEQVSLFFGVTFIWTNKLHLLL